MRGLCRTSGIPPPFPGHNPEPARVNLSSDQSAQGIGSGGGNDDRTATGSSVAAD